MAYHEFTFARLKQAFGVSVDESTDLFSDLAEIPVPPLLAAILDRQAPLALNLNTEKAKSELLVAPVLLEIKFALRDRISFFSGVEFTIDAAAGLNGRCDFLLARSPGQLDVNAPVCVVVEAKNENIIAGIPQAIAEMVAARLVNERAGAPIDPIYGVVTSGTQWRFLKLTGDVAHVDAVEYPIQSPGRIYAILTLMALGE